jgi:serine/threonine protein kinase/Tol biopolymer transport system component
MPLSEGTRLGSYEILSPLAAGGMGEVYRARDTRLDRDVAIKILPEVFAADAERVSRFQREARVLASLNHPHIAAIYGLEDTESVKALVMELVEGEDLAQRLARGAVPLDEALPIAKQIAEALEAAHERGIIHRDLKPANIKVRIDGTVKVLDFGLAKALEPAADASPSMSMSPTITPAMTQAGIILGTAAYMSPEQAKGQPGGKRSDIWAFGCVVYEMLTGVRAFKGTDIGETLAAIVRDVPDWERLPVSTPAPLTRLLRRALEKDSQQRLADMADARLDIEEALTPSESSRKVTVRKSGHSSVLWISALALGAVVGAFITWRFATRPAATTDASAVRFAIALPSGQTLGDVANLPALALSPNSREVVYVVEHAGVRQLFRRAIDRLESVPIAGTEGVEDPFFSPDGQWVGFFADRKLKKVPLSGGAAITLCDLESSFPQGATWAPDGTIYFAVAYAGIFRIRASGGTPTAATTLGRSELDHRWPEVLPDGKTLLFTTITAGTTFWANLLLANGDRRVIGKGASAHYVAPGYLVYAQGYTLHALPFDVRTLQISGSSLPVLENVMQTTGGGMQASISSSGSLAYIPALPEPRRALFWVDRQGNGRPLNVATRAYLNPRISPDGRRVALQIDRGVINYDVWVLDFERDSLSPFTFGEGDHSAPVWTPDGQRLTFGSTKDGPYNLYWKPADGSGHEDRLFESPGRDNASSWSPDGRVLLFTRTAPGDRPDIWTLTLDDKKTRPLLQTRFAERSPVFSPDGRWIAYVSNESGRFEVYVRAFDESGKKWPISNEGGDEPVWPKNAHEIFFRTGDRMMSVAVTTGTTFSATAPRRLFEGKYLAESYRAYDATSDGMRFLVIKPVEEAPPPAQIAVVVNWSAELKRLIGSK